MGNGDPKYYIVKTDHKAAYIGQIADRNGEEVMLKNARRLWHWSGAADVMQLAMEGVKNPEKCRFTVEVPMLIVLGVREIVPVTEAAAESIRGVKAWKVEAGSTE